MSVETMVYVGWSALAYLIISRIVIVKLARNHVEAARYPGIAPMDYFPVNFPSEAAKELSAFWKVAVAHPRTLIGVLAGLHVVVWFLILIVVLGLGLPRLFT